MTTMTYTTATPSIDTRGILNSIKPVTTKIWHALTIICGVNADRDTRFRGLDLNGNPMWSK